MPNVFYDQGDVYFCSFHLADIEPDDHACEEGQEYGICAGCPYCEKQSYRIVTKDEKWKHLIYPERKYNEKRECNNNDCYTHSIIKHHT